MGIKYGKRVEITREFLFAGLNFVISFLNREKRKNTFTLKDPRN